MKVVLVAALSLIAAGCAKNPAEMPAPEYQPAAPAESVMEGAKNGAIYSDQGFMSLYSNARAARVGDLVTVVLRERTQSRKSSSTSIDKSSNIGIAGGTAFGDDLRVLGKPIEANFGGSRSTGGDASSDKSNSLSGSISVTVQSVLPNGNLVVRGEKWLTLNQGDEVIRISGIVRPRDINANNEVESVKLADAKISYGGRGALHDANTTGWLTRFFLSPNFAL